MKVFCDEEEILNLQDWQRKVLEYMLPSKTLDEDIKRRLKYVINHKIDQCFDRLEKEWTPKLRDDPQVTSVPADKKEFVKFVTSRTDYMNRDQREAITETPRLIK